MFDDFIFYRTLYFVRLYLVGLSSRVIRSTPEWFRYRVKVDVMFSKIYSTQFSRPNLRKWSEHVLHLHLLVLRQLVEGYILESLLSLLVGSSCIATRSFFKNWKGFPALESKRRERGEYPRSYVKINVLIWDFRLFRGRGRLLKLYICNDRSFISRECYLMRHYQRFHCEAEYLYFV